MRLQGNLQKSMISLVPLYLNNQVICELVAAQVSVHIMSNGIMCQNIKASGRLGVTREHEINSFFSKLL